MKSQHPRTDIFKDKIENKRNNIKSILIDLKQPISMKSELTMNKLSVLVGANGVGKTLFLKLHWAMAMIGAIICQRPQEDLKKTAQFVFDNTFTNNNFDGVIILNFDVGNVMVKFESGKIADAKIYELKPIPPPIFMSSGMRTFDSMVLYLHARKGSKQEELLKIYKLYDIFYVEKLISRCPINLPERISKHLRQFDFPEIKTVNVNLDSCQFSIILENGEEKNLTTFGKGHQALLNMTIGQI